MASIFVQQFGNIRFNYLRPFRQVFHVEQQELETGVPEPEKNSPVRLGSDSWKPLPTSSCRQDLTFLMCKLMNKSARTANFG